MIMDVAAVHREYSLWNVLLHHLHVQTTLTTRENEYITQVTWWEETAVVYLVGQHLS